MEKKAQIGGEKIKKEKAMQIFSSPELGQVRTIIKDGEPSTLADAMGLLYKTGRPNAKAANELLEACGLQEAHRQGKRKVWTLTEEGKRYGESGPFTSYGHSDYSLWWSTKVIPILKRKKEEAEKLTSGIYATGIEDGSS